MGSFVLAGIGDFVLAAGMGYWGILAGILAGIGGFVVGFEFVGDLRVPGWC